MNGSRADSPDSVDEAFGDVLAYLAKAGENIEPADLQRYNKGQTFLTENRDLAVSFLSAQFASKSFLIKKTAYAMLVALGRSAIDSIKGVLDSRDEIAQLWLISVLHFHGDVSRIPEMIRLLVSGSAYVRHLAALAIVFQGLSDRADAGRLLATLIDGLSSNERIEGSIFHVADSALSCVSMLTGVNFAETQHMPPELYNFNDVLFGPPMHPFPYTSDRVTTLPPIVRQRLIDRVQAWWNVNRDRVRLNAVKSCYDM